jgi:hypothetical protein
MTHQLLWSDEDAHIPNMRFSLFSSNLISNAHTPGRLDFAVHTVQDGVLKDHRIVKIKMPGSSTYKGFGFLMSDMNIKVWNSMRDSIDPLIVVLAERVCRDYDRDLAVSDFTYQGTDWQVILQIRCVRCNIHCSGYWCSDHAGDRDDLRESIARDEQIQRYASQRARRVVSSADLRNGESYDAAARRNAVRTSGLSLAPNDLALTNVDPELHSIAVAESNPPRNLPLSENGTGLIR